MRRQMQCEKIRAAGSPGVAVPVRRFRQGEFPGPDPRNATDRQEAGTIKPPFSPRDGQWQSDQAFRRTAMNRKPTKIRPLVTALLTSGLLVASTGASADHRRHSNDVAEGLLAGALAALTIGIIIEGIDGWHGRKHLHSRPDPYRPSWKYRHAPRHHGWDYRHRKGHRHWKRHRHGYRHRPPHRSMHRRVDRGRNGSRPSHDRRGWNRVH